MRHCLPVASILAFAVLVGCVWSAAAPRPLTPDELLAIRGGEIKECYKDGTKRCLEEAEEECGGLLEPGEECGREGFYDVVQQFDKAISQTHVVSPGVPGAPWYDEEYRYGRVQCWEVWSCKVEEMNGFRFCEKNEFKRMHPPETAAPFETYADGAECEGGNQGG